MENTPNLSAEIQLPFGGEMRLFKLGVKQIENLQKLCEAPIGTISGRLFAGFMPHRGADGVDIRDIYHTIHLGLVGGGMSPLEATNLCKMWIDGRALAQSKKPDSPLKTAVAVMSAAWFGLADLSPSGSGEPEKPAGL